MGERLISVIRPTMQGLFTPATLAAFLHKSVSSIYRFNSDGTGPSYYRVGGECRYSLDDVFAWLDGNKVTRETGGQT